MLNKKIWANFQRIIEVFTQKNVSYLSKIWVWDAGSGKNLFRIPDPGVKKAPDPGSGSATLKKAMDPGSDSTTLMDVYFLGAADNSIRLWDIQTGKQTGIIDTKSAVRTCNFSYRCLPVKIFAFVRHLRLVGLAPLIFGT
jgi:WD40 repeat protein